MRSKNSLLKPSQSHLTSALLFSIGLLPSCSQGNSQAESEAQRVFGSNELMMVSWSAENVPELFRSKMDAIGRMQLGCTVTHVGNGLVLTAGHCFKAGEKIKEKAGCDGDTFKVVWGERSNKQGYLTSKCTEIVVMQDAEALDYALFKVDQAPNVAMELEFKKRPHIGHPLTMFGHPRSRPLHWSGDCHLLRSKKPATPLVDMFYHQCDTEHGNSGSAILSRESGKIVGIHNGGFTDDQMREFPKGANYATFVIDSPLAKYLPSAQ